MKNGNAQMFSIKDLVAQEYGPPYLAKNAAVAMRSFQNMMKREQVINSKDYELYMIGSWYSDEGKVVSCEPSLIVEPKDDKVETVKSVFPGSKVLK